jgi:hypothetical protein
MKLPPLAAGIAAALMLIACNVSGLSNQPRATFSQLGCLDTNGDHRLNAADAASPSSVPDFDGDRRHDANDAAFLQGIDIPLDPVREQDACSRGSNRVPEYLVAHGYFEPAKVSCAKPDARAVLLVGVAGGVVNLKDKEDAAGVRSMVDALQKAYDGRGVQTIAVLAGPAIAGAVNVHSGMEEWMAHAVQVYLDRYPCIRVVLLGHSHGAITADVVASRLEGRYAGRIIDVVDVDRVEVLYIGDLRSRPRVAPVFNIYQTTSGDLNGAPYDAPNAENWDASKELGPHDGAKGGKLEPVNHTTIDNSTSVRDRIVAEVLRRS